ncbi:MAG: DUF3159 domain-containing protein [Actinomycetota bacterium]|nr:DUF3159 domain-containing protein [Actinomycetota bacterium]
MTQPDTAPTRFVEQLGGVKGLIDSGLPVVVFVVANALAQLKVAIIAALVAGVAVFALRLARRESPQFAVSGLFGVAIAAYFAHRLGRAEGFFIPGILLNAVYFVVFAGSLVIRRPLIGVLWTYFGDGDQGWRQRPVLRGAYTLATLWWALMYAAKTGLQGLLYLQHQPGWLAVAKLSMGYPLFAVNVAATLWLVRRAKRRMGAQAASPEPPDQRATDGDPVNTPTGTG